MRAPSRSRLALRAGHAVFVVLLLCAAGLAAWLTERHSVQWDWTAAGRNSLSAPSEALLARMPHPVRITAYAREQPLLRQSILQLVERYRRVKPDIELDFVDPDHAPDVVRELGITADGELLVRYRARREHAKAITEEALTGALHRLARADERWVAYLAGHGERSLDGDAAHDLGRLGEQLTKRGFNVQRLVLATAGEVPDNTSVLVISRPVAAPLPGEVAALHRYVETGGNLLWLADPGAPKALAPVAETLGLDFEPGTVVDPASRLYGIEHPAFVTVAAYPDHPVTRDFELVTVFPHAAGIAWRQPAGWETRGILSTGLRAWSETGELEGEIAFDEGEDASGPLDIGVAMRRPLGEGDEAREQRVIVVGDGDFLSNAYLGNGGNLELALNAVGWLAGDDELLDIPAKVAPDLDFELSRTAAGVIAFGALIVLPAALLAAGALIWHRRRRR